MLEDDKAVPIDRQIEDNRETGQKRTVRYWTCAMALGFVDVFIARVKCDRLITSLSGSRRIPIRNVRSTFGIYALWTLVFVRN